MTEQEKALFNLGLSADEVAEVLADDAKIDKGEKLFELSKDQEKASKKARAAGRAPTVYKFNKRERKADLDKSKLIGDLLDGVPYVTDIEIINREREFTFTYNEKKYKVVLSAPRS